MRDETLPECYEDVALLHSVGVEAEWERAKLGTYAPMQSARCLSPLSEERYDVR